MLASLQYGAKCPCGYCHISDVESHKQDDHMESFFLAETVTFPNLCQKISLDFSVFWSSSLCYALL
jgi:Glycosyl hydrolase family 47